MIFRKRKKLDTHHLRQLSREIDPDEIFLDAANLPHFDKNQFEGRMEKPIGKGAIFSIAFTFFLIEMVFLGQVMNLQIFQGEKLFLKSERNRLEDAPLFAMRGMVYDRNGKPLAWNVFEGTSVATGTLLTMFGTSTVSKESTFARRAYTTQSGFGHVLGYISYPKRDSKGRYYQQSLHGVEGVEESYDALLQGKDGRRLVEIDALGEVQSGNIVEGPKSGNPITLSIDALVQENLYRTIEKLAEERGYRAGAGAIMDVENGALLALASYPEYKSSVLSDGSDKKNIQAYLDDKRSVFLNRAVSGVYTPGSIIKPIIALAALNEGVIVPEKQILSTGSIAVQNPYNPALKTVFNDWKAHGWTDMRRAIAVSSDVYFYSVGGGFEDQRGIGIANIEKYMRMFGFGETSGIDLKSEKNGTIPNPAWKANAFAGEPWRLGDTYNTAIGQYGFQVTVLQAVRAIGAIANGKGLVTPHLIQKPAQKFSVRDVPLPGSFFEVVRAGMRDAVLSGTAGGLNVPYVTVAAKTGTAEIDAGKKYINSWIVGFFPYEKPRYAFVVVMERGPYQNSIGGVFVMRQMLDWMSVNAPEYVSDGANLHDQKIDFY